MPNTKLGCFFFFIHISDLYDLTVCAVYTCIISASRGKKRTGGEENDLCRVRLLLRPSRLEKVQSDGTTFLYVAVTGRLSFHSIKVKRFVTLKTEYALGKCSITTRRLKRKKKYSNRVFVLGRLRKTESFVPICFDCITNYGGTGRQTGMKSDPISRRRTAAYQTRGDTMEKNMSCAPIRF